MRYRSEFLQPDGNLATAVLEARDEQELHDHLHEDGCTLLRLRVVDKSAPVSRTKRLSPKKLLQFMQAMESSMDAGVPLLAALEAIEEQEPDPGCQSLFRDVRDAVSAGDPLSMAMSRHPNSFPSVLCALIQAGEQSGGMSNVLVSICSFLEWKLNIAATVRQAIVYPAVVLTAGYALLLFLMAWVIPKIGGLLGKLGADALPAAGRWLIASSGFVSANLMWVIGASILAVVGLVMAAKSPRGAGMMTGFLARMPVARTVVRTLNLTSMFTNLAVLLNAGLALPRSLELVANSMSLPRLRESLLLTMNSVLSGAKIHESFGNQKILPPVALGMLRVGEETGRLPTCMERLARTFDREAKSAVQRAISLLEPVVTIALGFMVGTVAVLVITTLYTAMRSMGK